MATEAAPPAGRRQRNPRGQGDRLRDEIIDAARRVLDRSGRGEAVTLRAVAGEARIAPQSMYRHFADRDALLYAVADARCEDLRRAMDTAEEGAHAGDGGSAARSRLQARAAAYCTWALEHPGQYQALFGVVGVGHPARDRTSLPGSDQLGSLQRAVAACLPTPARPHADAEGLALRLWQLLHGAAGLRISCPDFPWPPLDHAVDDALDALGLPRSG